jgi:hypothetical protein
VVVGSLNHSVECVNKELEIESVYFERRLQDESSSRAGACNKALVAASTELVEVP